MKLIFSKTSVEGRIPKGRSDKQILADAISDWGCCIAGGKVPANFGDGMVEVSNYFNIPATPEDLIKLSKKL